MILLTGATGNVGGAAARALLDSGVELAALVRPGRESSLPAGVVPLPGDLNDPASLPALDDVSALFLLPGYGAQEELLRRVRGRVVLLSGRSVLASDLDNPISRYMLAAENAVRDSGEPWTIVRPSGFMSNTLSWAPQLTAGDVVRTPFADVHIAMIDPADVSAVIAVALTADHAGQTYEISGPEPLRPADRVRILGDALGRGLRFEPQSDAEARAEMLETTPQEFVDTFFAFYSAGTLDESEVLPTVPALLGRPARTFAEWAADHAPEFQRGG